MYLLLSWQTCEILTACMTAWLLEYFSILQVTTCDWVSSVHVIVSWESGKRKAAMLLKTSGLYLPLKLNISTRCNNSSYELIIIVNDFQRPMIQSCTHLSLLLIMTYLVPVTHCHKSFHRTVYKMKISVLVLVYLRVSSNIRIQETVHPKFPNKIPVRMILVYLWSR